MTEQAREAKRRYQREWAHRNPDRVRLYQRRYWERRAVEEKQKNRTPEANEGKGDVNAD